MTGSVLIPRPVAADIFAIYDELTRLGVPPNYAGFRQGAYAVFLCVQNPDRLALVTKWLYPEVARRYHTTDGAIQRNIRTAARRAWAEEPERLSLCAGHGLSARPSATQFIAILTYHFLRNPPAA